MRTYRGEDRVFEFVNTCLLGIALLIVTYPLIYILSASVSDPDLVINGTMKLLPRGFTLDGYRRIFGYHELWIGYANTIYYTVVGTLLNLIVTLPCAYALSRKDLAGRGFLLTLFMITMYIGGGLVPSYLNLKQLGLLNTRAVML
ncbi:MAG: carbohydrate ABC transporter permease, partial [Clostridia bacterium]